MTHEDIYIKFMIEYDKANVASSYPSLTEYEVATFLDKAYNAIIAQKVTGNNPRRVAFEADVKAISDLQGLIKDTLLIPSGEDSTIEDGDHVYGTLVTLPSDFLYFISLYVPVVKKATASKMNNDNTVIPGARNWLYAKLVSHEIAKQFMPTSINDPWVQTPVCYIANNKIATICDSIDDTARTTGNIFTYIKKPNPFVKNLDNITGTGDKSFFKAPTGYTGTAYDFELSDSVANEVITLAVTYALENTEQSRFNSHAQLRPLEA